MSKLNIVKVREIAFTKLRKHEVYTFYNDIMRVIGRYDTKAMHIEDTCDVLIGMRPKAELLVPPVNRTDAHPLTLILRDLSEKRLKFAAIIANQMRTAEKAGFADKEYLVELAKPMVLTYMNYLRQNDLTTIEVLVAEFFSKLKENPEIKDALLELGFKLYLDELESANNDYINTLYERTRQISRLPKGSTLPIQRELQRILRILFDQVDSYQHIYLDVDYSVLITALNHTIATYTKLIKTRETQRKNKKLKAKEDEEAALEEKLKMGRIEKTTSGTVDEISSTSPRAYPKEKKKTKPSTTAKKNKGKDKSTGGLLNILKKPDKGKNGDGASDEN